MSEEEKPWGWQIPNSHFPDRPGYWIIGYGDDKDDLKEWERTFRKEIVLVTYDHERSEKWEFQKCGKDNNFSVVASYVVWEECVLETCINPTWEEIVASHSAVVDMLTQSVTVCCRNTEEYDATVFQIEEDY